MPPESSTRFRLKVQYDGSPFHGWQLQPGVPTVQGALEEVLTRISGAPRRVVGSGRTDRGVHALAQIAAVDLPAGWRAGKLRSALNALLPEEIRIFEVRRVHPDFHPRYDALERSYDYLVGTERMANSPFHARWCWALPNAMLDREALGRMAALLPGERSFRSFAKAGQPERGERCRVVSAEWRPWRDLGLRFTIRADRYLHHMVRYLVGTMIEAARGIRPEAEFAELLHDPDGDGTTSPPAPARGLFLTRVVYPSLPPDIPLDCDPLPETP